MRSLNIENSEFISVVSLAKLRSNTAILVPSRHTNWVSKNVPAERRCQNKIKSEESQEIQITYYPPI